jgi:hypothetical protein
MQTKLAPNKPANRWLDVQIVIATLAMTFVLALWNLFAGTGTINNGSNVNSRTQITTSSSSVSSAPSAPGTILFGGSAPSAAPSPMTVTRTSR